MKTLTTRLAAGALATLMMVSVTGCDFNAVSDAVDDFDIIIGLDPINTVVNGVVVDAGSGDLVAARLTFAGQNSDALIDAWSDPIQTVDANDGVITFGISNAFAPTPQNPFVFDVEVEADGYYTTTQRVILESTGDAFFQVSMGSTNVFATAQGTAGSRVGASASGSGQVQQNVSVQTGAPSAFTQAQAEFVIPQGTTVTTSTGTPLANNLTTEIRVYDAVEGARILPAGARTAPNGTGNALVGATYFKLFDDAGNVATRFQSVSGKGAACNANDTRILLTSNQADLLSALTNLGGSAPATVYAYLPATGANTAVGSLTVDLNGGQAELEVCMGTNAPNVDLSGLGAADVADGIIFTFALDTAVTTAATLNAMITVSNTTGAPVNVDFSLVGGAVSLAGSKTIPTGSNAFPLKDLVGNPGVVNLVNGTSYVLSADVAGVIAATTLTDPAAGTAGLDLPTGAGLASYNLSARVECPAGETFDVQITSESMDAVSVFYRISGVSSTWALMPNSAITSKVATDSFVEVAGGLSLKTSTSYEFKAVLGADSATHIETTPPAGGNWTVGPLDSEDFGLGCSAN